MSYSKTKTYMDKLQQYGEMIGLDQQSSEELTPHLIGTAPSWHWTPYTGLPGRHAVWVCLVLGTVAYMVAPWSLVLCACLMNVAFSFTWPVNVRVHYAVTWFKSLEAVTNISFWCKLAVLAALALVFCYGPLIDNRTKALQFLGSLAWFVFDKVLFRVCKGFWTTLVWIGLARIMVVATVLFGGYFYSHMLLDKVRSYYQTHGSLLTCLSAAAVVAALLVVGYTDEKPERVLI